MPLCRKTWRIRAFGRRGKVRSHAVPRLVDTSIRVLSQEPLAGADADGGPVRGRRRSWTVRGLRISRSRAAGSSTAAVRRGVESPWERIRALKARTKTPLALAVRGRFLVGSRPVRGDFARRFVACAAESGIDVFRLHDPLNDVENLKEAAEAIVGADREFDAGLLYGSGRHEALVEAGRRLPELGADAHPAARSRRAARSRTGRASSSPSSARCRACPSGSTARARAATRSRSALEAARAGADLIATAIYPVALATAPRLGRVAPRRRWPGLGDGHRRRPGGPLARDRAGRRAHRRRARLAGRAADRRARGAAQAPGRARRGARRPAAGAQAAATASTRCSTSSIRCATRPAHRRSRHRWGRSSRSQALLNVLSRQPLRDDGRRAARSRRGAVRPHARARSTRRSRRAVELYAEGRDESTSTSTRCATRPTAGCERGGAAAARALRRGGRAAAARDPRALERRGVAGRVGPRPGARRPHPRGGADRAGDGHRRDHDRGERDARQRPPHRRAGARERRRRSRRLGRTGGERRPSPAAELRRSSGSRARWSGRSTARPHPARRRSSRRATRSLPGQTLCILEAMKLMNEVKAEAEAIVRKVHVGAASRSSTDSSSSSSSRSTAARSTRSRCSSESWLRTGARSPSG